MIVTISVPRNSAFTPETQVEGYIVEELQADDDLKNR
jgi:hypothetical protein